MGSRNWSLHMSNLLHSYKISPYMNIQFFSNFQRNGTI